MTALHRAVAMAPAPVGRALAAQSDSYDQTMQAFSKAAPASAPDRVAAKAAAAHNMANAGASAF
jgi:hypothetical protein